MQDITHAQYNFFDHGHKNNFRYRKSQSDLYWKLTLKRIKIINQIIAINVMDIVIIFSII